MPLLGWEDPGHSSRSKYPYPLSDEEAAVIRKEPGRWQKILENITQSHAESVRTPLVKAGFDVYSKGSRKDDPHGEIVKLFVRWPAESARTDG